MLRDIALFISSRIKRGGIIINNHTQNGKQIRCQVETLSRYFDFIHHNDLLPRLKQSNSKPFCLFTFDDGKKINAIETAPELERLGVPAVFYVTTDFLYHNQPLWFDLHDALRQKVNSLPPDLELTSLKQLPYIKLKERIDKTCKQHEVTVDISDPNVGAMSWDDARTLYHKGFTIGAHSTWHAILTNESPGEANDDIRSSIVAVTRETGSPCPTFAFTNGNYTPRLAQNALIFGVETVMTTEPVWANASFPPWRLPRIQIHNFYNADRIALKVMAAMPGCILKNPDGTGRKYVIKQLQS